MPLIASVDNGNGNGNGKATAASRSAATSRGDRHPTLNPRYSFFAGADSLPALGIFLAEAFSWTEKSTAAALRTQYVLNHGARGSKSRPEPRRTVAATTCLRHGGAAGE